MSLAHDSPPAPSVRRSRRRGPRHAGEPPLPVLGRIGLGLALLTAALVGWRVLRILAQRPDEPVLWQIGGFLAAYAGGLVLGWARMRPAPGGRGMYTALAGVFLVQGLAYVTFWAADAAPLVAGAHAGWLGIEPGGGRSEVALCAGIAFVLVGPLAAAIAAVWTRHASAMLLTQVAGPVVGGLLLAGC